MIALTPLYVALLAFVGLVAAETSPGVVPPPPGYSDIRTDDAAWRAACGRGPSVGAVCLDISGGSRPLFKVETAAQQNVKISAGTRYLVAYCPNLDKGEKPYKIMYSIGGSTDYYKVLGRKSNERCCNTQYIGSDGHPSAAKCIQPGTTDKFP